MTKQELHTRISYIKSILRIVGYGVLIVNIFWAAIILIGSEFLGIAEELWGA